MNALGRLEDPRNAVRFLIGARCVEVDQVASILYELNEARKTIERSILNEIEWAITQKKIDLDKENIIIAASDKWPAGVIGLVASRLTNQYNKPALLFHITKDGLAKGSARSISAFNIFEALQENAFLLERFGGHAGAAGLSLKKSKLPELKELLEQKIARDLSPEDLIPRMVLEAQVQLGDLTAKFMDDMRFLEPFGHMNDAPLFFIDDVTLVDEPTLLKDQHVKCKVFSNGVIKPVIFFGQPQLFSILSSMGDRSFALAATVMENHWQGTRSIELKGLDIGMKVKE